MIWALVCKIGLRAQWVLMSALQTALHLPLADTYE